MNVQAHEQLKSTIWEIANLIMRFNEQANEEAGDHFTPREVIRLMASLIYTGEQDVYKPGIYRTIYDSRKRAQDARLRGPLRRGAAGHQ